ncbi:MAG: citramalate synthase [Deltaproteobacteria bacterium]|nr:citramalate synthase [Deltaproteobacteria bacterium]
MAAKQQIYLYDTTLRDGMAGEGVNFSTNDKVLICEHLDRFGVHYIEGGYPGSNPKEMEFFAAMAKRPLATSKLTAFGATRRKNTPVAKDPGIKALLDAKTPAVCIFGKSSEFQVKVALNTSLKENLAMISDSVAHLKSKGREVVYDAEHFFDGFKTSPEYTVKTLEAAQAAGADFIVLCDTNGGTLPGEIETIVRHLVGAGFTRLGIHTHNDTGCGVANSLVAVDNGCIMVHGTVNGLGERTGNADLCAIIPSLQLKMGYKAVPAAKLKRLSELSHFVAETANMSPDPYQPYVGKSAFSHKGGAHGSAVRKDPSTYEHIDPNLVGNTRKLVVSEIAGRATLQNRLKALNIQLDDAQLAKFSESIKAKENEGYSFEDADGSIALMALDTAAKKRRFFQVESYHVHIHRFPKDVPHNGDKTHTLCDATLLLNVNGVPVMAHSDVHNGPVNALDAAMRKCLEGQFPAINKIQLTDYKVRVIDGKLGTKSVTRVWIESTDGKHTWGTVGVSPNIIAASWAALKQSVEYGLYLHHRSGAKASTEKSKSVKADKAKKKAS